MSNDTLFKELIQEILAELSPDTLYRYKDAAQKDADSSQKKAIKQMFAGDQSGSERSQAKVDKRYKGMRTANRSLEKQSQDRQTAAKREMDALVAKVKNPETGEEILATTAYKAGPQHPAYQAAKAALKKEVVSRINEGPVKAANKAKKNAWTNSFARITPDEEEYYGRGSKVRSGRRNAPQRVGRPVSGPTMNDPLASRGKEQSGTKVPNAPSDSASPEEKRKYDVKKKQATDMLKRDISSTYHTDKNQQLKRLRVRNPATGGDILAYTAYKAGPEHPAYNIAKTALQKEVLGLSESFMQRSGVIRMTDFLNENVERRVNLMKIQTVMEKLYPELNETQSKKLMELCTEAHMMASQLNSTRYIRTESSLMEWKLLALALESKLGELKKEVISICEQKKINPSTVVKAIDEVISY